MVVAIFAGTQGYLDRVTTERVQEFQNDLRARTHAEQDELLRRIRDSGQLSDEDEQTLHKVVSEFVSDFGADFDEEGQPLDAAAAPTPNEAQSRTELAVDEAQATADEADLAAEKVEA
jgi:F-type H+-transporting ATPase subunit alpha